MTENVDCYNGGVICRKSLLINIGRSVVAFDDDSGRPVRTISSPCQPQGILLAMVKVEIKSDAVFL